MLDLGTLRIGIKIDKDSLSNDLKRVGNETEQLKTHTDKVNSAWKTVKRTVGSLAIAGIIKEAGAAVLESVGQYEQLTGGIKKLFGDADKIVMKNAQKAYKTAGISANKYMEQATSFSASLINSLGGD